MNRVSRYIAINIGIIMLLIVLTGEFAYSQNFSGVMSTESAVVPPNNIEGNDGIYGDVTLTESAPAANVNPRPIVNIPDVNEETSRYTLGKEDIIEVSVLRHPEVSGEYIINNEGKIQYEFIGDVTVEGLKKDEVEALLVNKLSEFIITPDVTIKIVGYNSKIVYVIGEVAHPGKIFMRGDTITAREALVQAGLPLLTGKVTETKLITPSESGKAERKKVNVHKLLYEGDLRENLVMKPGDTLYIPPTFMAKALRVIQPVAQPINTAGSTGRRVYTGGF